MDKELIEISKDIRQILDKKRKKTGLYFIEEDHKYFINNAKGESISDLPSVSGIIKKYYEEFPKEEKALQMSNGDTVEQAKLLDKWAKTGEIATSLGSRVHYILEKYLLSLYDDYKEVRKPIFDCDLEMIKKSNKMISAGVKYIDFLHQNNCVLLDTEMVLGDIELGYFGQPDKVWLIRSLKGKPALMISDWKTNKPSKFEIDRFTKNLYEPFNFLPDNSLGKYSLQLPLYGRLLLKMLENTPYSDIKILKYSIVNVKDDCDYKIYDIDKSVVDVVNKLKI